MANSGTRENHSASDGFLDGFLALPHEYRAIPSSWREQSDRPHIFSIRAPEFFPI
jgi:hypothetical protein